MTQSTATWHGARVIALGGFVALALALATSCASRQVRRAEILVAQGDPDAAASAAQAHLARHPGDRAMQRILVMALADAERRPEAVAAYAAWHAAHGHDRVMLDDLAMLTLRSRLGAASPAARIAAIKAVEALQLDAFADDVALRMNDGDDEVAAYAAIAVLRGYHDSIAALRHLIASSNARARAVVVAGMARKLGAQAVPLVFERVTDASPLVRVEVARALALARDAAMRGALLKLTADAEASVAAAAITSLGTQSACAEIARLRAAALPRLATLRDAVVRAFLALPCPRDPLASSWLTGASADPRLSIRLAAARAPAAPASLAVSLATSLLASDVASDQRAGLALRDRLPPAHQPMVMHAARRLIASTDPWVSLVAADALAASRQPADVALVATAYARALAGEGDVALAAAAALAPRGDANAIATLEPLAAAADVATATRAIKALSLAPKLSLALPQALAADDERAVAAALGILRYLAR